MFLQPICFSGLRNGFTMSRHVSVHVEVIKDLVMVLQSPRISWQYLYFLQNRSTKEAIGHLSTQIEDLGKLPEARGKLYQNIGAPLDRQTKI